MFRKLPVLTLAATLTAGGVAFAAEGDSQGSREGSLEETLNQPVEESAQEIEKAADETANGDQETAVPAPEESRGDLSEPGRGKTNEQGEVIGPVDGQRQDSVMGNEADTDTETAESAVPSGGMSVKGTVTDIDMQTGYFNVDTKDGASMRLHADPSMLQGMNLEKGQKVTAKYEKRGEMNHVTQLEPAKGKSDEKKMK